MHALHARPSASKINKQWCERPTFGMRTLIDANRFPPADKVQESAQERTLNVRCNFLLSNTGDLQGSDNNGTLHRTSKVKHSLDWKVKY